MSLSLSCNRAESEYSGFEAYPVYQNYDLGITYGLDETMIKIYAPTAKKVMVQIYHDGLSGDPIEVIEMKKGPEGTWSALLKGDYKGKFYTVSALHNDWSLSVPDPYARAVGVNGKRGAIINMKETDPTGWENDRKPELQNFTDIILYELHVRDLSTAQSSGIANKGKFLGIAETGTKNPAGETTGLDHIKELGVTHVHLLPIYDFFTIDEAKLDEPQFNWGYDPQNYNVPEGSYATDPFHPEIRIRELKQMVQVLHKNGLRVVMDVVYNHTFQAAQSNLNQLVPGYYYRHNEDGTLSDASACGNEVASERPMVRKMIIESVLHWAREYHIDGFRFDLMGILDIETMNQVRAELDKIDPTIFIYGEGWTAASSPLDEKLRAVKKQTYQLNNIAAFSDDLRDGIKGHWNDRKDKGFVSGKPGMEESIKFGIVASTLHPQVQYDRVNYSDTPWAAEPYQCINYASCHDDNTLWDKLEISNPRTNAVLRKKMHLLSQTIVLTSQGVPFLHAGTEFLRTKYGNHNSYKSPDSINQLDWLRKSEYIEVFEYMKKLIHLRKNHPAFRMTTKEMIVRHLTFPKHDHSGLVYYKISAHANGDSWKDILVFFNGNQKQITMKIPKGNWKSVLENGRIDEDGIKDYRNGKIKLSPVSACIIIIE